MKAIPQLRKEAGSGEGTVLLPGATVLVIRVVGHCICSPPLEGSPPQYLQDSLHKYAHQSQQQPGHIEDYVYRITIKQPT